MNFEKRNLRDLNSRPTAWQAVALTKTELRLLCDDWDFTGSSRPQRYVRCLSLGWLKQTLHTLRILRAKQKIEAGFVSPALQTDWVMLTVPKSLGTSINLLLFQQMLGGDLLWHCIRQPGKHRRKGLWNTYHIDCRQSSDIGWLDHRLLVDLYPISGGPPWYYTWTLQGYSMDWR